MGLRIAITASISALFLAVPSLALAGQPVAGPGSGQPDVWTAPLPPACTLQYDPVVSATGDVHGNRCQAAFVGIRVTWPYWP